MPTPERRWLRTFAFDPMSTRLTGRYLRLDIPYEDLRPGPIGQVVQVVDYDPVRKVWYSPLDLSDPSTLAQDGLRPSESDPRAHQQVVYAVAMSVTERFERFLGRRFSWHQQKPLRLVPHAFGGRNAYFDPRRRAILFGYYPADETSPGANLPGQMIFSCLSSDIIAHEVTHAIVHRLRRHYSEATNIDVLAWHEAFADLVALFQHFIHRDVLVAAVAATSGDLLKGGGLLDLAAEFGESSGMGKALRSVADVKPDPLAFAATREPHARGAIFVAAVFDAYMAAYQDAIADLLRIATGGTGVLPPGRLHPDLVNRVADEAARMADRFLGMVIRAFDYLPVVDVDFGDVVRAIVTADYELFPGDTNQLRSRLVEALRRRGIYPRPVSSLADDALRWPAPTEELTLGAIDVAAAVHEETRRLNRTRITQTAQSGTEVANARRLAADLNQWATDHAPEIGLEPGAAIAVIGVHATYRQGENHQPRPEVVVQFGQRRDDLENPDLDRRKRVAVRAGTTLIADLEGRIKYVVAKPLPTRDPASLPNDPNDPGCRNDKLGRARLERLEAWMEQLETVNALSPWTSEPALLRLDFAALDCADYGEW
ncbi:MAG: hypothetical protein EOP32_00430 [Rhodococcus sp. (in: high G+C Gram-positive bacteria)]|nr:MAG: hypothetical protein EOP32_00430 [Rhodococcus sp. (in: high G+C Gram-positive bacteria)]